MRDELTQERLKQLLHYNPETGVFVWRVDKGRAKAGSVAGTLSRGYVRIKIDNGLYFAHRLAWLHTHGVLPNQYLDHINQNRSDNRMANLRDATSLDNNRNTRSRSGSSSRWLGVMWYKRNKKWGTQIRVNGKQKYFGLFECESTAAMVYNEAALEHFGEFASLNEAEQA